MVDCAAEDILGSVRDVREVYAWYSRLAELSARRAVTGGGVPLSAQFLRRYLAPGSTPLPFRWMAPYYLLNQRCVQDALDHHRSVYLSEERTRAGRLGGIQPRFSRVPREVSGDRFIYGMHYESLVTPPLGWTLVGTDDQKDIALSLGTGWQLRTEVTVTVTRSDRTLDAFDVEFVLVLAQFKDLYDFDPAEHHTMPNPDVGSGRSYAICPGRNQIVVYHSNALRMERAGLAEPYPLESDPWIVRWRRGTTPPLPTWEWELPGIRR